MAKVQVLESGQFRVQIQRNGKQLGGYFDTYELAAQRLADIETGIPTFAYVAKELYLESSAFAQRAKGTRDSYRSRLKRILLRLGSVPVDKIDSEKLSGYIVTRQNENTRRPKRVSPKGAVVLDEHGEPVFHKTSGDTIRLELAVIYLVMRQAIESKYITVNPVRDIIDRPKPGKRTRRVSLDESTNLLRGLRGDWQMPDTPSGRKRPVVGDNVKQACRFFLIQLEIGCRSGELAELPIADIDLASMSILLEKSKTGRQRRPLSPMAAALIKQQMDIQQEYWRGLGIEPQLLFSLDKDSSNKYRPGHAETLVEEAGLVAPGFHPHATRREFVSSNIENGTDYETIMRMTGQVSMQTVKHYDEALNFSEEARMKIDVAHASRQRDLRAHIKVKGAIKEAEALLNSGPTTGLDLAYGMTPAAPPATADVRAALAALKPDQIPPMLLLAALKLAKQEDRLTNNEIFDALRDDD